MMTSGVTALKPNSSENGEASQLDSVVDNHQLKSNQLIDTRSMLVIFERNASSLRLRNSGPSATCDDLAINLSRSSKKRVRRSLEGEGASVPPSRTSPTAFQKDQ